MGASPSAAALDGRVAIPSTNVDLMAHGYLEQEFVLQGSAASYERISDRTPDGRWNARPGQTAEFATRVVVRRPTTATRFSGAVLVEWLNVTTGTDISPGWVYLHRELLRRGHAYVAVSAQQAGVQGGGPIAGAHLTSADPDRYGSLDHPGDAYSFGIFTAAAEAIRQVSDDSLLGGLVAETLIASGQSQSASFLSTYINAVAPLTKAFDGYLVHAWAGVGPEVDGSRPGRDQVGRDAGMNAAGATMASTAASIRSDADAPVLVLQPEGDTGVTTYGAGRTSSDRVRFWEISGAAHGDSYMVLGDADDGTLSPQELADCFGLVKEVGFARGRGMNLADPANSGPQQHYLAQAALDWLLRWSQKDEQPPIPPRLDFVEHELQRDQHGIALGGLRTPWVQAPHAVFSGTTQGAFGTTRLLTDDERASLYPNGVDDYLTLFGSALDEAVATGYVLPEDREEALAVAPYLYAMSEGQED